MLLKKINTLSFIALILCGQLLIGCVSVHKYPSTWPSKKKVTTPSQLSGVYHPGLLHILSDFMDVPYVPDTGSVRVQLLINDSLQYQIKLVPVAATGDTAQAILDYPTQIGTGSRKGFTVKKNFKSQEGLRISYNPYESTGGQGRPIVSHYFIILNKDKNGNLVIKHGKEAYGEAMLVPYAIEDY